MAGEGFKRVADRMRLIARRLNDMRPILAVVATDITTRIKRGFDAGVSPSGEPWTELAESTLAGRRQQGRGAKPLLDTGRLKRSIVASAAQKSITYGTNVVYAAIQNYGGQAGRGRSVTIPARRYMPTPAEAVTPADRERVRRWLLEGTV